MMGVRQHWLCSKPLALWLALWLALAYSAAAFGETVLEGVDVGNLPGGRVQLRFRLSQPPAAPPRVFTINDPARIVLDFVDARSGLPNRQLNIGSGVAEKINFLQGGDRTRASINLARLVPYDLRSEGNVVVLTLEAGAATPATRTAAAPVRAAASGALTGRTVGNLDFRRSPQGDAVITIRLSNPAIPVDVREEGNQIVADFQGAVLPRGQERRLDVTDFATPVTRVDAMNRGSNARLSIQPIPPYEYLAYQADDLYTIEVKPVPEKEEERLDAARRKKFTGDLLSLNFQDIEVRAVLQIIADFTGQNVVVSDTVQGNLTLRLQNVPWDQALDIILRTKGLTMRQQGNVMYIAPTEEVAAREKLELEAHKTVIELVPLRSELIQVNYAKASALAALLKSSREGKDASLLSPRGQVSVDDRTNSLLVQDVPERLTEIRDLVVRLDRPVRQVMIDSRLVSANDNFSRQLGIQWGVTGIARTSSSGLITSTGSLTGTSTIVNSAITNLNNTGQPFPTALPPLEQRLGVLLPAGGAQTPVAGRLALAILGQDYLVDLELSALQAEGRGEILSNPRVVTTDRQEATIKQGEEIPYQSSDEDGDSTTIFKEAVLELKVVPQITPDNRIIMDLTVKKDARGQDVPSGRAGGAIPTIRKQEVSTQVLVDNGETVVLGGVFEQDQANDLNKVPLLGDIPVLGYLFQRNTKRDNKTELLIFVTPQILDDKGVAAR